MPTHNEALQEAYASCPPNSRVYFTLELWQSSFAAPARVVANVGDDKQFGIEAGARFNAGETVNFVACPFAAEYPEQREGQPPSTKIRIDNVNRDLVPKIRGALGVRQYLTVTYREYLESDLSEPAYGPVEFNLTNVVMSGATLTGTAIVKNLVSKRFPRADKNYSYTQFPSLLP